MSRNFDSRLYSIDVVVIKKIPAQICVEKDENEMKSELREEREIHFAEITMSILFFFLLCSILFVVNIIVAVR